MSHNRLFCLRRSRGRANAILSLSLLVRKKQTQSEDSGGRNSEEGERTGRGEGEEHTGRVSGERNAIGKEAPCAVKFPTRLLKPHAKEQQQYAKFKDLFTESIKLPIFRGKEGEYRNWAADMRLYLQFRRLGVKLECEGLERLFQFLHGDSTSSDPEDELLKRYRVGARGAGKSPAGKSIEVTHIDDS